MDHLCEKVKAAVPSGRIWRREGKGPDEASVLRMSGII